MAATLRNRTPQEFGNLPSDGKSSIQVGNGFVTADATGSPNNSPLVYTSSVTTILVPQGAIQMSLLPTTDLRISEVVAMSTYDLIKANTKEIVPCAGLKTMYIKEDASDGSVYFKFIFV